MAEGYVDGKGRVHWSDRSQSFQWVQQGPEQEDDETGPEDLHSEGDEEDEPEEED
ncbi:MAG TPA: hypothetical protein VMX54_11210 [Vicinamibacteria bacterium]|nr:hypothetical protein [Vicinamibacteria bacterium]